jgi:hypothetical protein
MFKKDQINFGLFCFFIRDFTPQSLNKIYPFFLKFPCYNGGELTKKGNERNEYIIWGFFLN